MDCMRPYLKNKTQQQKISGSQESHILFASRQEQAPKSLELDEDDSGRNSIPQAASKCQAPASELPFYMLGLPIDR